jgi:hypothetical protein
MDNQLRQEAEDHYRKFNKKLEQLQSPQHKTKKNIHNKNVKFYRRTENLMHIDFNEDETTLLDKGLQHSIEKPTHIYWDDLIMDTEQAIRKLEPQLQEPYRILAAKKTETNPTRK